MHIAKTGSMQRSPGRPAQPTVNSLANTTTMSRLGRTFGVTSVLLAALFGAGCSDDPTAGSKDAGVDGGQLVQCAPNAPEKHRADSAGYFTFAALPTGACSGMDSCSLPVYGPCGNDPEYVGHPYNIFQCTCTLGSWSCAVASAGSSICAVGDGGTKDM